MALSLKVIPGGRGQFPDAPALVAGLQQRAPWALDALAAQHGPRIHRVVVRILGPGDADIQDVVHETFARALEGMDGLAQPGALGAWMAQIAVFVARETIRRRQRSRKIFSSEPLPDPPGPHAADPAQLATRCLYAVLRRMPVDERILLVLRRIEGQSHEQLAQVLSLSVPTVRRHLKRAEHRFDKLAGKFDALAPWRDTP